MDSFKIGSLNLNGARDVKTRVFLYDTAKLKKLNVLFIQETHSDDNTQTNWVRGWEGKTYLKHGTTASVGVGFLFKGFQPAVCEGGTRCPGSEPALSIFLQFILTFTLQTTVQRGNVF